MQLTLNIKNQNVYDSLVPFLNSIGITIVRKQKGSKKRIQDKDQFWQSAGKTSLDKIWNNPDDNIYAELLKK